MKSFFSRLLFSAMAILAACSLLNVAHADALSITVGQSAKVSVTADGTQPFTYQWFKNGVAIAGATAADCVIGPTTAVTTVPDQYSATVTNAVDSTTSDIAYLTVTTGSGTPSPTITTQPIASVVTAGQSASFSVVATGTGSLTYQWSKGGVAISGATAATYTISNAASAAAGSYTVSVTNTVGGVASAPTTSAAALLTVNAPPAPTIMTQPTAKSVTAGQSASFSVVATGSGTLSYQWTKGGVAISGATASTYAIASTVSANAGSYAVSIVNTVSSIASAATTSTAVSLTVNPALVGPTITTQPTAQSVTVGQPASFSVVATGSATLTYQWSKGGVAISGATAATYTLASTTTTDAGSYAVTVTNSVSSATSTAATLTVNAAPIGPVISSQPVAQAKLVGQSASFTVTATGSATLTYQWTKGGTAISGATSATYSIPSVAIADAGNYAVVVINSVSSVTSSSVALTVTPPAPTITTQPVAQSVTVGQSATFTVAATGSGTLSYQWTKGGVAIAGATSATYTIASTVSANAGSYAVSIVNTVSSIASAATTSTAVSLTVNAALVGPTITTQPTAQSVTAGQSATFSVVATGSATLTYQWSKGGAAISGATAATYTLASTTSTDAGSYAVTVTNSVSSVTSTAATLTVNAAPVGPSITTQPVAQTVTAGQSVSLSVTATGSATLTYQWTKNGASITGATAATYSIANAASGDAGSYAVVVTNSVSSVTSSLVALVVSALAAPVPDGYAAAATGGAAGQTVSVSTAVDFKTYAQSTTAYVINVSGTINLGGSALVKSNKTIQGIDANAAIIGCLDLSSVSNVIIRGLTISNPGTTLVNGAYTDGGDGVTIRNSSNVFITHCSLFNCADQLVEISTGADNVTVSWSEFYYNSAQTAHRHSMITGVAGSETKPLHVTLHHNWWSDLCDASLPSGTYGYVHLYNNYFKSTGNTSASNARDQAQFFAERNVYEQIKDPLYKENVETSLPAGLIRSINNVFTGCTGKAADAGTDAIFTPSYSYELLPAADVSAVAVPLCGNTAGAASATPSGSVAAITGPIDVVPAASSFTLTAAPSGFTGVSYQWRRNNFDISGATASTYTVASAQTANAGIYTVVIGLAAGDFVTSSPLTIELGVSGGSSSSSSSGGSSAAAAASSGGGGGGAPSGYFLLILAGLGLLRKASRRGRS